MTSWSCTVRYFLSSWTRFSFFFFHLSQSLTYDLRTGCVQVLVHLMAAAHGTYPLFLLRASRNRVSTAYRHASTGLVKLLLRYVGYC
jgi:hypothetical protein